MVRKNLISLHEAIVLALLSRPSRAANFRQIAAFITKRNLFPNRKGNLPLEDQVMLRTTKSKGAYANLFEDEGNGVISLKDTHSKFPLMLWNALEALMDFDRQFYNPDSKTLGLIDKTGDSKELLKLNISPINIVCILSHEKSRKKKIYVRLQTARSADVIKLYYYNSQEYNFETLHQYLDPATHYLAVISKSAIVNVGYFDLSKKQLLQCNLSDSDNAEYFRLKVSGKKADDRFIREFKIIKEAYTRGILLQKTAFGYKSDLGL